MEITLFLVGKDQEEAQQMWPFDNYDSARSYADPLPGNRIFSVTATLDFSSIEEVED